MKVRRQHHHSTWGFAQFLFLIPESVTKRDILLAFTREMPEATEISDRTGPRVDGGELRDGRGELRVSE